MKIAVYLTPTEAKALATLHTDSNKSIQQAAIAAQKALNSLTERVYAAESLLARVKDSEG